MNIRPFIMCGGSGTRLWPVSRGSMPKQFQSFIGDRTLLQETVMRVQGPEFLPPTLIASEHHRFLLSDQMETLGIDAARIVLEPASRNTAAVALIACLLAEEDGDDLVLLLPSDHAIRDAEGFRRSVLRSCAAAAAGHICLFGIKPTGPATGYGYIQRTDERLSDADSEVFAVSRFIEKPTLENATAMASDEHHLWNAGIFLLSPRALLTQAERIKPELLRAVRESLAQARRDGQWITLDRKTFEQVENISIDYAFLEQNPSCGVHALLSDWSDLGAWDAIYSAHHADADGNVVLGKAFSVETTNSYIRSDRLLVTTIGLNDAIVVASDDAILVADKSKAQEVKSALALMRRKGVSEVDVHAEVHRPWGSYRSIVNGNRFQVKLITVKPGGRLSLQLHRHRAEHWVVVRGTAQVTCGDGSTILYENQSTFIPQGEVHRLANPGHIPLEIIEVQSGSYLGEDDIVRVEDVYGRIAAE